MKEEIQNTLGGIELLHDWLGEQGEPVTPILANFRASRCLTGNNGDPCPMNVAPNWWDKVKNAVAFVIKAQLQLKHGMNLRLSHEDNLNMCQQCGCCLKLKCWVPTKHIKEHTAPDKLQFMPDYCWIKRELQT